MPHPLRDRVQTCLHLTGRRHLGSAVASRQQFSNRSGRDDHVVAGAGASMKLSALKL